MRFRSTRTPRIPRDARRPLRRAARAALVLGLLAAIWVVPGASGADPDPTDPSAPGLADPLPFPRCPYTFPSAPDDFVPPTGLPATELCNVYRNPGSDDFSFGSGFAGVTTLGVQGAPHLAQWVKVPLIYGASDIPIHSVTFAEPPAGEIPDVASVLFFYPRLYFLSADRTQVGEMPPFRVTTMAFGSVPVQVTINISQPRAADGSVQPIGLRTANPLSFTGAIGAVIRDSFGQGQLVVRLSDLRVDRRRVDLGDHCQTRTPATLKVYGEGYSLRQDQTDDATPPGKYNPRLGGLLHGSLDIPAFANCGTGGDDLSPLLTNGISGADNPLTIFQGAASDFCFPLKSRSALSKCDKAKPLPVPTTDPEPATVPDSPYPLPD